jgi:hypothetical protein
MKQRIEHGAVFDFATPAEVKTHLDAFTRDFYQEKARGISPWEFQNSQPVDGSGAVRLPATSDEPLGPNPGFAVLIPAIRGQGMVDSDIVKIYRLVVDDLKFVGQLTVDDPVQKFNGPGLLLRASQFLVFSGTGLSGTTISVNGDGTLCPEEDLYKLLSP